ncbi:MAG: HIT domain-containing protein [Thermomicrobiales bacterium]|nr:HIT domain-containing protein [Thermomicrobiales bacterium]
MSECPFCTASADPSQPVLATNDLCYLLGYQDESLHGMMVIPFRHVESPFDLTAEEWAALQPLILRAQELLSVHNPDGFNLGWNVGTVGGQEVQHVHLHVFARFADEPYAGYGIRRWFKSAENRRP